MNYSSSKKNNDTQDLNSSISSKVYPDVTTFGAPKVFPVESEGQQTLEVNPEPNFKSFDTREPNYDLKEYKPIEETRCTRKPNYSLCQNNYKRVDTEPTHHDWSKSEGIMPKSVNHSAFTKNLSIQFSNSKEADSSLQNHELFLSSIW